jgi:hypothetical protein
VRLRKLATTFAVSVVLFAVTGCGSSPKAESAKESPCKRYPLTCEKPGSGATPQEYEKAKEMAQAMTPQEYEAYVTEAKSIEARQTP